MDKIVLKDLVVAYRVGVPEAEREQPQRLLLTVELLHDFTRAAARDDLSHSIDYAAVAQRLLGFGQGRSWKLIETLARDIAEMVLQDFKPREVFVEVKKFVIPEAQYVSVSLRRERTG